MSIPDKKKFILSHLFPLILAGLAVIILLLTVIVSNAQALAALDRHFPDFTYYVRNSFPDDDITRLPLFCSLAGRISHYGPFLWILIFAFVIGLFIYLAGVLRPDGPAEDLTSPQDAVFSPTRTAKGLAEFLPFVLLFLCMLWRHAHLPFTGDDVPYSTYARWFDFGVLKNVSEWVLIRNYGTGPRAVIESFSMLYLALPHAFLLWKILNPVIYTLIAFMLSRLLGLRGLSRFGLCLLILFYPMKQAGDAGWVITSLFYLWVLFAVVCVCFSLQAFLTQKLSRGRYAFFYLLYAGGLIYGANQEQGMAILLGFHLMLILWQVMNGKKPRAIEYLGVAICLISAIHIFSCHGSAVRSVEEAAKWFPEYAGFSLFRKIDLGVTSTMEKIIFSGDLIFFTFTVCLAVSIRKTAGKLKALTLVPPLLIALCSSSDEGAGIFPVSYLTRLGTFQAENLNTLIPWIIYLAVIACVLAGIFLLSRQEKTEAALLFALMILGFGSRFMMGLSPTIWASGERTFIFLYFAVICAASLLVRLILYPAEK